MNKPHRSTFNSWTPGWVAAGLVSVVVGGHADESLNPVQTTLAATTISGYVDTSAILNFGPGNTVVGRSFDGTSKQDGFNLNVAKLQIEKPLDEAQWSAGYRIGLLFGPDANTFAATSSGMSEATSDFAIKNAYVNLRAPVGNGLEFKVGVWDTILGYEVLESGNNPNYSRSFGFFLEPIVHTGILASYKVNDVLSLSAGVADPNNVLVNPNTINARTGNSGLFTYMGAATLTAPEGAGFLEGGQLTAALMDHAMDLGPDIVEVYVGGTMPLPIQGLALGLAYDYRGNESDERASSADAQALAGYLVMQATEKLKFAGRVEYAWGTNGTWYTAKPGERNELLGVTATVQYALWNNVVSRVEFRWDHDLSDTGIFGTGTADNSVSLALNVIYNF